MKILITGGTGFLGSHLARRLAAGGHTVTVFRRASSKTNALEGANVRHEIGDVFDASSVRRAAGGQDVVIHAAGSYRIGIPKSERGAMWDANVGTTTRILDAAEAAATPRFVYVSTGNVYGNTHGKVVDETYRRDLAEGFLSWYDETKYGAHEVAEQRIHGAAPVMIVLPSQVYGPGDHSGFGEQLQFAHDGRLRYRALDDVGVGLVHVDDLAAGIVAALDRGRPGQSYNLAGPRTTLGEAVALAAALGGHRPPALRVPTTLLRAMAPLGGLIGQPNLDELVAASAGVTYWLSADKATAGAGVRGA